MPKKILRGKIISESSNLTAKVEVERFKTHPKYKKQFKVSRRYLAHNPANTYKVGQNVEITETKPISKRKRFIIIKEIKIK